MGEVHKVLVTGANGFVGKALASTLLDRGFQVRVGSLKRPEQLVAMGAEWFPMTDLSRDMDWRPALDGMDGVVHLAAIAHRMDSKIAADWKLYDQVNHLGVRSLAMVLRKHSTVKRFLFTSTIRVHGDPVIFPVNIDSPIAPVTPYDRSKAEAERAIRELLSPGSLSWAIIRPVLVYGPGNRGNMARLEGLLRLGVPIPIASQGNKRSFVFIGNLISAIEKFIVSSDPPSGRTWIVADGEPVSTESLLLGMAVAMNLKVRLVHVPEGALSFLAKIGDLCRLTGLPFPWNTDVKNKFLGDFYVDISATKNELDWVPPFSLEDGLRLTYGKKP